MDKAFLSPIKSLTKIKQVRIKMKQDDDLRTFNFRSLYYDLMKPKK